MLDLVFTKLSEDILSFDRGPPLGNSDHLSLCYDYVCLSWPNSSKYRKRNLRKGDFEGMKHHLHLQNWDTMLVSDIETKWLGFKTILLELVEKICPLVRSKRPLAKPWLSKHIFAMQKQKKKMDKKFCSHFPKSTGRATKIMTGFTPGHCGVPGQFMNRTSLRVQSGTRRTFQVYRWGNKKWDPISGWGDHMALSQQMMRIKVRFQPTTLKLYSHVKVPSPRQFHKAAPMLLKKSMPR